MSFLSYSAGLWTPSSAAEHAVDCLNQINSVLAANNIQDSSRNLIQFAASLQNVVWIICLAIDKTVGMRASAEDEVLGIDLSQHHERAYTILD